MTITIANTESLSVNDQYSLITDIQNVPTTVTPMDDGSEYVTYGVTPASEAAGARLTAAFMPAIQKAARQSKLKGREDESLSVAMEAFVRAVREYDLTSDTPFHHTLPGRLRHAVLEADRTENPAGLSIPAVQVARYHRVMHAHGNNAVAAKDAVAADTGKWLLSPEAFLTVHRAIAGVTDDVDAQSFTPPIVASPEDELITRYYARWLLAQTTDRQESICRLAYGFADQNTERLRVLKGYREGDVLEDLQVADCLDMARSTVARDRLKALATMRAAAEKSLADE